MDIVIDVPDIKCSRCGAIEPLEPNVFIRGGGKDRPWRFEQIEKPSGWLTDPAAPKDATSGLCPTCAKEWAAFMAAPKPVDPIALRQPYVPRAPVSSQPLRPPVAAAPLSSRQATTMAAVRAPQPTPQPGAKLPPSSIPSAADSAPAAPHATLVAETGPKPTTIPQR